ncbi:HNH endonuclease [Micromonospora carbonacea]|nr:HNH endonuclease [Micromonospora carbonacea]MBB5828268.1 putative restriction endonuclease [Micromonospora carbonacea]
MSDQGKQRQASQRPQLLLQLRGGARERGPQHYEHSVKRGIRLTEIAAELGPELAILRRLYPDGVARLWGSTPSQQVNNAKVRALRNRQAGDHVLFYAGKTFYSRARILHLFRNPAVAKRVWQTADDGQTWEHIVALGEVEQFDQPVPAGPILAKLGLPNPLRSLTLVTAAQYAAISSLLPTMPGPDASPEPPAPRMKRKQLFAALQDLVTSSRRSRDDPAARNLPLVVLWAIGRIEAGEERLVRSEDMSASLTPILDRYGAADRPGAAMPYPSGPLAGSGLWEVRAPEGWEVDPSGFHGETTAGGSTGSYQGFLPVVAELFDNVEVRGRAVAMLSRALAPGIDRPALLSQVGLAGYDSAAGTIDVASLTGGEPGASGPAKRKSAQVERIVRSSRFAAAIKQMYDHQCQVCGVRLETRDGYYSEAAHIQGLGKPHDGPDEISNLLCLCPNHHVQFDFFAIYIDDEFVVRRTSDDKEIGRLHRHEEHGISPKRLKHHRRFCGLPG